jgi:hypothetical protein
MDKKNVDESLYGGNLESKGAVLEVGEHDAAAAVLQGCNQELQYTRDEGGTAEDSVLEQS